MSNVVIRIDGVLSREKDMFIAEEILAAARDLKNVILLISSEGGDSDLITPIWEAIRLSEIKVTAIGMIDVASAAASIFMMADRRILLPNTRFLLHKSTIELKSGDYSVDSLLALAKEGMEFTKIAWEPIVANSTLTFKLLNSKCKGKDWVLSEKEITSYGIITESYDRQKMKEFLQEENIMI